MDAGGLAVGQHERGDPDLVAAQDFDGLGHRPKHVQDVLPEREDRHGRPFVEIAVPGFDQVEGVHHQARLVHPVGGGEFVDRDGHAAVLRCPADRVGSRRTVTRHPAREHPHVRRHVLAPVHGPSRDHQVVVTHIHRARTHIGKRITNPREGLGIWPISGPGEGDECEEQAHQQRHHADRQARHRELVAGLSGALGLRHRDGAEDDRRERRQETDAQRDACDPGHQRCDCFAVGAGRNCGSVGAIRRVRVIPRAG